VFIIDDVSGEPIAETSGTREAVAEPPIEARPPAADSGSRPAAKSDPDIALERAARWQIRDAEIVIRGTQRLAASVERSLADLLRLTEHLRRSQLFGDDVDRLAEDGTLMVEKAQKVRELLHQLGVRLKFLPRRDEAAASSAEPSTPSPSRKR